MPNPKQTRSLFILDTQIASWDGVGVYLYDLNQEITTLQPDLYAFGKGLSVL